MLDGWRTEIAFGTTPDSTNPAWRDVTSYVDAHAGINISGHGRTDQFENVNATQASQTLDNKDGRFTAEYSGGAYYPNVTLATRLRHSFRFGTSGQPTVSGNFLSANAASMETSVADWTPGGSVPPTLSQSSTHAQDGTKALLITWGTAGSLPLAQTTVSGLTIGRTYTASAYFYVPSGGSPTALIAINGAFSSQTSVTNAFQRRSVSFTATATSATFQVWPGSAPTAGNQVWVDAVQVDEGSAVGTFTTAAPPIFYRFDGCIDTWPVQWAPTGLYAEAQVTATDRLARLGLSRSLPDIIGAEYLQDSPRAYYNLGDPSGSTSAGNSSLTLLPSLKITSKGAGGSASFGLANGPGTDSLTALTLARSSATVGKYLTADMPLQLGNAFAMSMECWFNTTTTPVALAAGIMSLISVTGSYFSIEMDPTGAVYGTLRDYTGGSLPASAGDGTICNDGLTHHVVFTAAVSGGFINAVLYVDGVQNVFSSTSATVFLLAGTTLRLGGGLNVNNELWNGTIAQVAVYNTVLSAARVQQHYLAGSTGFSGERSDQRIARLATYAGIAASDVTAAENGSSLVQAQDTTGQKALDAINEVTNTENGVTLFTGAGKLLTQGRSHRYNSPSKITLAKGQYTTDLLPVLDTFGVQNDVTATRVNGATVRVVNQTSVSTYGTYTGSIDSLATTDAEAQDAATWRVQTAGTPMVRFPQVTCELDKLPTASVLTLLALEVGDRITLTGLPSTGPATTVDLFIEGWSESFTTEAWSITFNCSRYSAANGNVWIFDDAASVFDTMRFGY